MKILFFVLGIALIISTASAISCSNVKISLSGSGQSGHEIISCDGISSYEISPELSFMNVVQTGNSLDVSGDITGKTAYGFITIYGATVPGQVAVRSGIRVPVIINSGTPTPTITITKTLTPEPTKTVKPEKTKKEDKNESKTENKTDVPTTYDAPIPIILVFLGILCAMIVRLRRDNK